MEDELLDTVGKRVRGARMARMLTQLELAEKAGVGEVTISRIEMGHSRPGTRTLRALAKALNVPAPWLAYGADVERTLGISLPPPEDEEDAEKHAVTRAA